MSEFVTETGYSIKVKIGYFGDDKTVIWIEKPIDIDEYIEVILTKDERFKLKNMLEE